VTLACIAGLISHQIARAADKPVPADVRRTAASSNDFGFRLLAELRKSASSKNVFISPTSLSMALSMTYNGAAGTTKAEMAKTLGVQDMSLQALNNGQAGLLSILAHPDPKVQTTIANALWVQKGFRLRQDYLARVRQFYHAPVTVTNITGDAGVKQINTWVSNVTKKKITTLLKPGDLDALTRLVLTNAVYFKGSWTTAFDPKLTQQAPFTLPNGNTKQVPMMSQKSKFRYFENDEVQVLRLPYGKDRLAMYLVLPQRIQDHEIDPIGMVNAANWEKWMTGLRATEVKVMLPRFKAGFEAELSGPLSALGMVDAFIEAKADFSGMTGGKDLYIKLVRHKAVLEVNEAGSEAAAATAVVMDTKSVQREVIFRADRPFLCAIRDDQTGALLFLGAINNPE
jgi:serpin B